MRDLDVADTAMKPQKHSTTSWRHGGYSKDEKKRVTKEDLTLVKTQWLHDVVTISQVDIRKASSEMGI